MGASNYSDLTSVFTPNGRWPYLWRIPLCCVQSADHRHSREWFERGSNLKARVHNMCVRVSLWRWSWEVCSWAASQRTGKGILCSDSCFWRPTISRRWRSCRESRTVMQWRHSTLSGHRVRHILLPALHRSEGCREKGYHLKSLAHASVVGLDCGNLWPTCELIRTWTPSGRFSGRFANAPSSWMLSMRSLPLSLHLTTCWSKRMIRRSSPAPAAYLGWQTGCHQSCEGCGGSQGLNKYENLFICFQGSHVSLPLESLSTVRNGSLLLTSYLVVFNETFHSHSSEVELVFLNDTALKPISFNLCSVIGISWARCSPAIHDVTKIRG